MTRLLAVLLFLALPPAARALCTSEGAPPVQAVLERFISADCADCWRDPGTPQPAANTLALDWIVPGRLGDDAPLSVVASDEAAQRLQQLGRQPPEHSATVTTIRFGAPVPLRLALGDAFNDYVGTTIELKEPGREPWQAWLLLVEQLPAGAEGSPVPRNLVRNVFRPDWTDGAARAPGLLAESRAMQIHQGARPQRLRLVALLQDGRGRLRAIARTKCP